MQPPNLDPIPATPGHRAERVAIYLVAFVSGAIVMSFEMLGSRYLNPYFGSSIHTWAALISTVLASLTAGYFIGGWLADRRPSAAVLGATILIGSLYILALPSFAQPLLEAVLDGVDDVRTGSLLAAPAILFFPVTFLGMVSPFAVRLLLRSAANSGTVSGAVYGVSTLGSIVGTLGTTFLLLPAMGSRSMTLLLGGAGLATGLLLLVLPKRSSRAALAAGMIALAIIGGLGASSAQESKGPPKEPLVDEAARAELLKRPDGQLTRIETEYNDIFITKRRHELIMSFQLKGFDYTESVTNLRDPDDLPVHYTRSMTTALAYPPLVTRVLMIGLGGGSISTYLGRAMPDLRVDVVEIDPGVISAAKQFFGIRESANVRYLAGDGRVFVRRSTEKYDVILLDAFHGGSVPFHLLTREFYTLLKNKLTQGGVAAFNVHDGTKLYVSTIKTLQAVFPEVHLYPSGRGEVAVIATAERAPDAQTIAERAQALQQRHGFRFPLTQLVNRRTWMPALDAADVLTDDFAPADDQYNTPQESRRPRP